MNKQKIITNQIWGIGFIAYNLLLYTLFIASACNKPKKARPIGTQPKSANGNKGVVLPISTASSQAATAPSRPTVTPAQPIATPAQPIAIPAQPIATPAQPIATPAQPERYFERKGDLFFIMERVVSGCNSGFWYNFLEKIKSAFKVSDIKQKYKHSQNSFEIFKNNFYLMDMDKDELWIAYAAIVEPSSNLNYDDIEMVMTVSTANGLPFSSHWGIFRSPLFQMNINQKLQKQPHKNISVSLHAFAARTILQLHADKIYMINAPALEMRDILIKALPDTAIAIGDNLLKEACEEELRNGKLSQEKIPLLDMMQKIPYRIKKEGKSGDGDIILLDPQGIEIKRIDNKEDKNKWFPEIMGTPYIAIDLKALARAG
ncbi:hypothetical protein [Candidatus Cardinium hertigii]|uniref:Uncharacterized protein n=1 Tax=Candidatus Cardinium hertigii TaxID=247481 RepID=A0A2Z3L7Q0_9BACT|nr:hypothetical protein [Candidatus Cardinium hertigii]AWN81469.1 hypothetical protein DK880_00132 [Candidatus Cardinium hertigii]